MFEYIQLMLSAGDVIEWGREDGGTSRGRVIVNYGTGWIDYYCFDDDKEDGTGRDDVFTLIERVTMPLEFMDVAPIRLVETKEMPKDEWLQWRRKGITGTDSAAIMGYSRFKTPLMVYEDKFDNLPEVEDNNHMKLGRAMEAIVADWFEDATGKKLEQRYAIFQHAQYDWMLANIDRKVVGEKAIAEMKIANFSYSKDQWGPTGSDMVPINYLIQVYHYMIVMGVRKGYLGVIFTDSREFRWYEFNLNEELARMILADTFNFWMNHVKQCEPPPAITLDDLNLMYPEAKEGALIANKPMQELCAIHEDNRQLIKKLEQENEKIKIEIGRVIGNFREIVVDDNNKVLARFTKPKPRETCDLEKLKLEFPEAYEKCTRKSSPKRTVKFVWQTLKSLGNRNDESTSDTT